MTNNILTILCVDDDAAILALRKAHFEGIGYVVLQARNGHEGLGLLATHQVDCVVVDFHLPGVNGNSAAYEMKGMRPDVPVVLVSGEMTPDDILQWVDGVLSKQSLPVKLLERIETLLLGGSVQPAV